jgi:PAS domain S-box-containing protein
MDSSQPTTERIADRRSDGPMRGAALLAAIVESSEDAIFALDLHGGILSWNAAAERMFGYVNEEIVGWPVSVLAPEELRDEMSTMLPRLRNGERIEHYETVRRRKDGALIEVSLSISPVRDDAGGIVGAAKIVRDISGRRAAEQQFRGVFEAAAEGIALTDNQGVITVVNSRFARMLGYIPEEMIGLRNVDLVHPEEAERVAEAMQRRKAGDGAPREYRMRRRDGGSVWAAVTGAPLRDSHGTITGVMTMVTDVTARREAEERMRRVLESIADGFIALDRDWRFTYVNATAERITGRSRESMIGRDHWEIFPETLGTIVERELRRAVAEQVVTEFETPFAPLDRWFHIRCYPAQDGGLSVYFLDVTYAKRAEEEHERLTEEVRASVERLSALVRATTALLWTTAPDGRFVTRQPSWEAYTGQPWPEYVEMGGITKIHPDDRERVMTAWPAATAVGDPYELEMRLWHAPTGEWRHTLCRGIPVRNADGSIREWVGVFEDIHERRLAEESLQRSTRALRESEDHYRNTVELNPQVPWTATPEGQLEDFSPQWLVLTGLAREQALASGWNDAPHPDDLPRMLEAWTRAMQTGQAFDLEHRIRVADGSFRWMRTRARPRRDAEGRIVRWYGYTEDIDARKRAEKELLATNEKLTKFLETCPLAVMVLDVTGVVTLWTHAAEKLYGWSASEVIGKFLPAVDDEHREEFLDNLARVFRGEPLLGIERVRRSRTGVFDAQVWAVPLTLADGQKQCLSIVADITERKRAEERYRETQKLESLGVLAGGIAHDFNNLLVGILGNASLAADSLSAANPIRALLNDVITASQRAADLTRQLLAYAGKGQFIVQPIDLSATIQEIAQLIQASIPKSVQLRLDLRPTLASIEADRAQIQQLVMNLIINAAEAVGEENGTVQVTTGVQDVDESYIRTARLGDRLTPGRHVFFEVQDTGCGMSPETLAKIFDPFFTTKFMGRGLGLAAALGIIRSHRGAIKVYSQLGKGSTFKALFPASADATTAAESKSAPETLTGAGMVLVVDDEDIVRRTVKASLQRYGYSVLLAENGQHAVELFRDAHADLCAVVLDMTMPVMSGEEALRQLRVIDPSVPVILSSGFSEAEAVRRFTGKGLAGFLQKPFTARSLAAKLRDVRERPGAI